MRKQSRVPLADEKSPPSEEPLIALTHRVMTNSSARALVGELLLVGVVSCSGPPTLTPTAGSPDPQAVESIGGTTATVHPPATPQPPPTSTVPVDTLTPTPTLTPARTRTPGSNSPVTRAASATPTILLAATAPISYPAPVITTAAPELAITITADFQIDWSYPNQLGPDEWFEVLGWEIGQDQKHSMGWTKDPSFILSHRQFCSNPSFDWVKPFQAFYLSVHVVRGRDGQLQSVLSAESNTYPWNTSAIKC